MMEGNSRLQKLIEKGYDANLVEELSSFEEVSVEEKVNELFLTGPASNCHSSNSPHVYFIGGQPGCGKSSAMRRVNESEKENGVVNVEMDAYRTLNPKFEQIKTTIFEFYENKDVPNKSEQMSKDLVAFTQEFADAVETSYTKFLFDKGYNIAIESTLRHPNKKIELASKMREKNPDSVVSVIMMGVSYDVGINGAATRAEQMDICLTELTRFAKENGIDIAPISRGGVDNKYYDSICEELPESIEILSNPQNIDILNGNVQIQDRNGNTPYDRNRDGTSISAKDIEFSSLYGRIAQKQNDELKSQTENFFGVDAFIKENIETIEKTYGSIEEARKIFEEKVVISTSDLGKQVMNEILNIELEDKVENEQNKQEQELLEEKQQGQSL